MIEKLQQCTMMFTKGTSFGERLIMSIEKLELKRRGYPDHEAYSHVSLLLNIDGVWKVLETNPTLGTRIKDYHENPETDKRRMYMVPAMHVSVGQVNDVYRFVKNFAFKYDYFAIFLHGLKSLTNINLLNAYQNNSKTYCSEWVAYLLYLCGIFDSFNYSIVDLQLDKRFKII